MSHTTATKTPRQYNRIDSSGWRTSADKDANGLIGFDIDPALYYHQLVMQIALPAEIEIDLLSRSGAVATAHIATNPGYVAGDKITITGATAVEYNVTDEEITGVTGNDNDGYDITFAVAGTPANENPTAAVLNLGDLAAQVISFASVFSGGTFDFASGTTGIDVAGVQSITLDAITAIGDRKKTLTGNMGKLALAVSTVSPAVQFKYTIISTTRV